MVGDKTCNETTLFDKNGSHALTNKKVFRSPSMDVVIRGIVEQDRRGVVILALSGCFARTADDVTVMAAPLRKRLASALSDTSSLALL